MWILKEGEHPSKLEPKSEKHTFIGFLNGPKAVKYYSAKTRQIKVSRDYRFLKVESSQKPPENEIAQDVQREGEREGDTQQSGANINGSSVSLKRKQSEQEVKGLPSRKSNRTKIMYNYQVLDDPYLELAELADDLEEGIVSSAEEIIYMKMVLRQTLKNKNKNKTDALYHNEPITLSAFQKSHIMRATKTKKRRKTKQKSPLPA